MILPWPVPQPEPSGVVVLAAIITFTVLALGMVYVFHKWEMQDRPHGWYY